jgi:hypothetical protein
MDTTKILIGAGIIGVVGYLYYTNQNQTQTFGGDSGTTGFSVLYPDGNISASTPTTTTPYNIFFPSTTGTSNNGFPSGNENSKTVMEGSKIINNTPDATAGIYYNPATKQSQSFANNSNVPIGYSKIAPPVIFNSNTPAKATPNIFEKKLNPLSGSWFK